MSAVETPTPAAEQPEQRRCPRCGSALTAEQEWCLECGAGVGATVAAPPSWRWPVALVVVLLAIAAVALVLALVELAGDAEQVAEQPAPAQTPAAQTPVPTPVPTATIPPASDPGTAGGTPEIDQWPAGKEGWTVVLEASSTEEAAQARADELAQQGVPVGMLDSDDFGSLEPGRFVVFSGQYDSRRAADQALTDLADQVEGAYVRRVAPE
ncbi:MAG: SPOR domain-containing protein [Solirubrobacteraceae bacterium]